ncbi:YveK family protein [Neobacillus sp. D3-1R]|uniref:YveK family protein n=1 Tax=Neobacillus sp. D3-1R TaxID=3445778 RepID=UPI003F9F612A
MSDQTNSSFSEFNYSKEINLKDHFRLIKKYLWIIILITFITTSIGIIKNTFFTSAPLYQSSTRMIIGADPKSMPTLLVLLRDSTILQKVSNELGGKKSPEGLAQQISARSIDGSQVVSLNVIDSDPAMAAKIANITAKVFKNEIPNIVGFNDIKLLTEAKINTYPINPPQNSNIVIAFIIGVVLGVGIIYFIDTLDDSVRSKDEIEKTLGITVLGTVAKMNKKNMKKKNEKQNTMELRGDTVGFKTKIESKDC